MTAGTPTIGGLKRLSRYLAGQLASAVAITGGAIDGATIGGTTPASVTGTKFISSVEAGTTAAALSNGGVSTFGSSVATTLTLSAPVAGVKKFLYNVGTSSFVSSGSTTIQFGENSSIQRLNFTAAGQGITLQGLSATKWAIESQNSTLITATT